MAGITDLGNGAKEDRAGGGGGPPRGELDISHDARLETGVQRLRHFCNPLSLRSSGGARRSQGRAHPQHSTLMWRGRWARAAKTPVMITEKGGQRAGRG